MAKKANSTSRHRLDRVEDCDRWNYECLAPELKAQVIDQPEDFLDVALFLERAYRRGLRHGRLAAAQVASWHFSQGSAEGKEEAKRRLQAALAAVSL